MDAAILDRIAKLMSLSKSSNVHEAELAAQSAAKLMARYHIDIAMLEAREGKRTDKKVDRQTVAEEKNSDIWKSILMGGIATGFGCKALVTRKFHENKRQVLSMEFSIIGTPEQVASVKYMFAYLVNVVMEVSKTEWAKVVPRPLAAAATKWYTAFRRGMVGGLCDRMEEMRKQELDEAAKAEPGAIVLVRQDEAEIDRWLSDKFPNLKKPAPAPKIKDVDAYWAGKKAAKNVSLGDNKELPAPPEKFAAPKPQLTK